MESHLNPKYYVPEINEFYVGFEYETSYLQDYDTWKKEILEEDIIRKSFRSKYSDVEDAIQIYCASTIPKMDCIVTRNTKDFKNSEIRALAPDQLLSEL